MQTSKLAWPSEKYGATKLHFILFYKYITYYYIASTIQFIFGLCILFEIYTYLLVARRVRNIVTWGVWREWGKHRKTSASCWVTTVYEMCYKNKLALPCLMCMQKHGVPSGVHKSIPVNWNRTNLTATLTCSRPQAEQKMAVVVGKNFSTMLFGLILFQQSINSILFLLEHLFIFYLVHCYKCLVLHKQTLFFIILVISTIPLKLWLFWYKTELNFYTKP